MLAKQEKREVYRWQLVNRLANQLSYHPFCSPFLPGDHIFTKHQRGWYDTRNIFVNHYTLIRNLVQFCSFSLSIFFCFLWRCSRSFVKLFFSNRSKTREKFLYFWMAVFAVRLGGIFSGKYSMHGMRNFVFSNGVPSSPSNAFSFHQNFQSFAKCFPNFLKLFWNFISFLENCFAISVKHNFKVALDESCLGKLQITFLLKLRKTLIPTIPSSLGLTAMMTM